jgi:hypothetical protein
VNTYSQNALRRFANSVNTALTIPMPSSAKEALAETLDKIDQSRLAGDAACLLIDSVTDVVTHKPFEIPSTKSSINTQSSEVSAASTFTETQASVEIPVVSTSLIEDQHVDIPNQTEEIISTAQITEAQAADKEIIPPEVIAPLLIQSEFEQQLKNVHVTDVVNIAPQRSIKHSTRIATKPKTKQANTATAFFQLLPWSGLSGEIEEDADKLMSVTPSSVRDRDTLPATRFFQSLCWSSSNSHFEISAGIGSSGGTVAPEELLITQNQRMALPIHQFFNQIPWTGNQPAKLIHH